MKLFTNYYFSGVTLLFLGLIRFGGFPPVAHPTSTTTPTASSAAAASATATATPAVPTQPPEERFETQLASLRDMGFSDNSRNLRALLASGGDVESAIEFLLRM